MEQSQTVAGLKSPHSFLYKWQYYFYDYATPNKNTYIDLHFLHRESLSAMTLITLALSAATRWETPSMMQVRRFSCISTVHLFSYWTFVSLSIGLVTVQSRVLCATQGSVWITSSMTSSPCTTPMKTWMSTLTVSSAALCDWRGCSVSFNLFSLANSTTNSIY